MAARRRFEFRETLDERFDIRFIRTGDDECWPWQAKLLTDAGYGIFWLSQTSQEVLAHRWAYERAFGPIPDGYDVDHTCHNNSGCEGGACDHRRCVNPGHLEAVPPLVNRQRSHLHTINRTHCPAGHPYDETNTYLTPRGGRRCKTCAALWKTADYVPDRAVNRARAEGHPCARLTAEQVREIRSHEYRFGLYEALGRQYGVAGRTIRAVRDGRTWRGVE